MRLSYGLVAGSLCALYLAYTFHHFYQLFQTVKCDPKREPKFCLHPELAETIPVQLRVYATRTPKTGPSSGELFARFDNLKLDEGVEKDVEVPIPAQTRNNGTLHVFALLLPADFEGDNFQSAAWHVAETEHFTEYSEPLHEGLLMGGDGSPKGSKEVRSVSHLRSRLIFRIGSEAPSLDLRHLPRDLYDLMLLRQYQNQEHRYLPILYLDPLAFRTKYLSKIEKETAVMSVRVSIRATSFGALRIISTARQSLLQLRELGFQEHDLDELKSLLTDTNLALLATTLVVSVLHLLFDALAFKNDIAFWRAKKSMVGVSTKTLVWRAVSQFIIFLYLVEQKTSLLVSIPAGLGVLVETWKLKRAFKVTISLRSGVSFGLASKDERQSEEIDNLGMKYLVILLVPLCIGGAIYSLLYVPHRGWKSWVLESAANGVYAFGFLFMLPQLFLNYRLKSVAHLPWRAFMYKAFNTFIDDLFAFLIDMPATHRAACFRDDIVFCIYLAQRWKYPVDRTRVNEFGDTFEPSEGEEAKEKKE